MQKNKLADVRPVLDNEHDAYIKTQLTFLDKTNPSPSKNKDFSSKFTDGIAKKIT